MTESSFDKIKKLIKVVGGKVIIVEDGKPTMVVINIDEYVDFEKTENDIINNSKKEVVEKIEKVDRINKDINVWKNRQEGRMLKQIEIENKFKERMNLENKNLNDNDEIVIEKL
jgi:PHD/YefM family antitoxin component YafN of YafNO toxin-antitoxin module